MSRLTEQEFCDEILAHGSVMDALANGIHWTDCESGRLEIAWFAVETAWNDLKLKITDVERQMRKVELKREENFRQRMA